MSDAEESKPMSRKSSAQHNNGADKDTINNNNESGGGGEVTLKAKMSLVNGITVIVGSIIGRQKSICIQIMSTTMIILVFVSFVLYQNRFRHLCITNRSANNKNASMNLNQSHYLSHFQGVLKYTGSVNMALIVWIISGLFSMVSELHLNL
jgi:hypothetical protein